MTSLLLEKEKEFHKLNAELEIRTKALMHEVDSVMRMQTSLANQNLIKLPSKPTCADSEDKWENYEENKHPGMSTLNKCLKAKIKLLQSERDSIRTEYKTKCNELKQLHLDCSKLEEENSKLQLLSHSYKEQKVKLSTQVLTLNTKSQSKDIEIMSLKKENDSLKKELKTINMNNVNNDVKLNKLLEELEKTKTNLKNAKQEEKEIRDTHKIQINELTGQNKRLEKQVTELTSGFRKQMLLVDNLKKQKMYLESAKLIQISEEEFLRILDWKPSES